MEPDAVTYAKAVMVGNLRAEITRLEAQNASQEGRWRREANNPGFAAASLGYGLLFCVLVPCALAMPFVGVTLYGTPGLLGALATWVGLFVYGRLVRSRFDARRRAIHRETPVCSRCTQPYAPDASYCSVCGLMAA